MKQCHYIWAYIVNIYIVMKCQESRFLKIGRAICSNCRLSVQKSFWTCLLLEPLVAGQIPKPAMSRTPLHLWLWVIWRHGWQDMARKEWRTVGFFHSHTWRFISSCLTRCSWRANCSVCAGSCLSNWDAEGAPRNLVCWLTLAYIRPNLGPLLVEHDGQVKASQV